MGKLETIEHQVAKLNGVELVQFRDWFAQFDAAIWDQQIEQDVAAGKLNTLAERALAAHENGKSSPL